MFLAMEIYCQADVSHLILGKRIRHSHYFLTLYTYMECSVLFIKFLSRNAKNYQLNSKRISLRQTSEQWIKITY